MPLLSRSARPRVAAPALAALLLGAAAGCEEPADLPVPDAAPDAGVVTAPEVVAADADATPADATDADAVLTPADGLTPADELDAAPDADGAAAPDEPAAFARIREALPEDLAEQLGPMMDGWGDRTTDPMAATQTAYALMQAGMELTGGDEELAYEAFRLSGEAGEAAVAGGLPDGVPRGVYGGVFYNQACALARAGEVDAALAALDRAAEYDFSEWEMAADDPDLAAVREADGVDFGAKLDMWKRAAVDRAFAEAEPFPLEFTFTDTEGEEHALADYRGEVVIVDFWGTWCPPCRAEIPTFVAMQEEYGDDGLQILGLNYEGGDGGEEEMQKIADFAEEYGMNYPTGPGSEEARGMVVPDFEGYPTTVFVGRDGTVRASVVGNHPEAFLRAVVERLLAEAAPETPADGAAPAADPVAEGGGDA